MTWFVPLFSSMAVADPPDVKDGALVSTVMVRAAELGDALPAASVATAVIAELPSLSAAVVGTVMLQLLSSFVVVEPSDEPPAKSSTELLASAVPVKVGVGLLVRLSVSVLPVSEAAVRSGVEGAAGAVSSATMVCAAEVKVVEPPAASVVVAMTRTSWPTRDWAEVSSC